jgi:hypothetical protein
MLRDLNKAGLTASGGECQFEELHRQFQREGGPAMRFFCFRTAPGQRGAGGVEKQLAAMSTLRYHDGDAWQDHVNWGENFPGGGGDNLYVAKQQPVSQEAWDLFGRFAREVAKSGIQALLHTQTEVAIEGKLQQLEKLQREGVSVRPFQTLYWAVTGKMVGGTVVNTHTISREAALIAHTRSNAYLFFCENDLGSIQRADSPILLCSIGTT